MYIMWSDTRLLSEYVAAKTVIGSLPHTIKAIPGGSPFLPAFNRLPAKVRQLFAMDKPDLVVSVDEEPLFVLESSTEAGTGHNVFQRFARQAISAEQGVPSLYLYPEAAIVRRRNNSTRWDAINPLILPALLRVSQLCDGIPLSLFYFPSFYRDGGLLAAAHPHGLKFDQEFVTCPHADDPEMRALFDCVDALVLRSETDGPQAARRAARDMEPFQRRLRWMEDERERKRCDHPDRRFSPLSATSEVDTAALLSEHMRTLAGALLERGRTKVYRIGSNHLRSDPYTGALMAIDYLECRTGSSVGARRTNCAVEFPRLSVEQFVSEASLGERDSVLSKPFRELTLAERMTYLSTLRRKEGKVKHIRAFAMADMLIFANGMLCGA